MKVVFLSRNCSFYRLEVVNWLKLENPLEIYLKVSEICCSVIVEALKVDSLQRLCSSLEPILRRVVR